MTQNYCEDVLPFICIFTMQNYSFFANPPSNFGYFIHLRKFFALTFLGLSAKTLNMRLLEKSHFSQMILPLICINKSKNAGTAKPLYHGYFHRLLLL